MANESKVIDGAVYEKEMTDEEIAVYRSYQAARKKATRKYNSNITKAVQDCLMSEVTINGVTLTLAEKMAIDAINKYQGNPDVDKLSTFAKLTKEYTDKAEVKVSGINEIMEKLKGDDF